MVVKEKEEMCISILSSPIFTVTSLNMSSFVLQKNELSIILLQSIVNLS